MRRSGIFVTGFAALLAALALTASGAEAAKKLVLSSSGKPLNAGATAFSELRIATCLQFSKGTLAANNEAKDKLTFTKIVHSECEPEFAASGGIETAQLTGAGVATYTANFDLTVPGPCIYSFKKFKGHFPVPGFVVLEDEEVGKLVKAGSSRSCEKTRKELFEADVDIASFGAPLETALLN
jgi:hypothetical protein